MNDTDPRLDRALSGVPTDVPPARDLWPGIAARLEPRGAPESAPTPAAGGVRPWRYALAASAAAVAVTAALTWQLAGRGTSGTAPTSAPTVADGGAQPATGVSPAARDAAYLKARAQLEATFEERLALLAPETRARVLENLEIIRRAEADIRSALEADPASPVLQQLQQSTRQKEIDLYTTIGRATEPALTRTST